MELLPGVERQPILAALVIAGAGNVAYTTTKPEVIAQTMNPAARAVVVGGTMFATYIMFDLLVRMWH
jgi:hypothetical protein